MVDDSHIPRNFPADGFLASGFGAFKKQLRAEHRDWFDFFQAVNRFAQEVLTALDVKQNDNEGLTKATLYLHALQSTQAAVIALQRGMTSQTAMLLRVALESLFKLAALNRDKANLDQYLQEHQHQRESFAKAVIDLHKRGAGGFSDENVDEAKAIVAEIKSAGKIRRLQVREWAEKADLETLYLSCYKLFCDPVHANPGALESTSRWIIKELQLNSTIYPKTIMLMHFCIRARLQY